MTGATVDVPGARLRYCLDGPAGAPVIVLSSSLGTSLEMWDGQVGPLAARFRVLRYDMRGHGSSSVSTVPVDVARLGSDVLALLDAIGTASASFVGLSLGGMVGLWLAAHNPERVDRLVVSNTAAVIGTPRSWNARIDAATSRGMEAITESVLDRWFTGRFRAREPKRVERLRQMLAGTDAAGYVAACEAIRDADLRDGVARISVPTLVVIGQLDVATPPAGGRWLVERIAGARLVELPAAHLSNIEVESAWNESVAGFLSASEVSHGRARTAG